MIVLSPDFTYKDMLEIKSEIFKKLIRHEELSILELKFMSDYYDIVQSLKFQKYNSKYNS